MAENEATVGSQRLIGASLARSYESFASSNKLFLSKGVLPLHNEHGLIVSH